MTSAIERDDVVLLIRGFANPELCASLTDYFQTVREQFSVGYGVQGSRTPLRLTNRSSGNIEYPASVYALGQKVRSTLGLLDTPIHDAGHGKDGVVVSITLPGGDVYSHVDAPPIGGGHVLRCNVLLSGGEHLVGVNGVDYAIRTGDLMCYLVSLYAHRVPAVTHLRTMLMYGFIWGQRPEEVARLGT